MYVEGKILSDLEYSQVETSYLQLDIPVWSSEEAPGTGGMYFRVIRVLIALDIIETYKLPQGESVNRKGKSSMRSISRLLGIMFKRKDQSKETRRWSL